MSTHDSGPVWFATPSPWWTCTSYSLPVSTGAPQHLKPTLRDHPADGARAELPMFRDLINRHEVLNLPNALSRNTGATGASGSFLWKVPVD